MSFSCPIPQHHLRAGASDTPIKLLTVGDAGVGKVALATRFLDNTFYNTPLPASELAVDFRIKSVQVDDTKAVRLHLWDTYGMERFGKLLPRSYRGLHGIIFAYDSTNAASFMNVHKWIEEASVHLPDDACKLLVATKTDRIDERTVSPTEALVLAKELGMELHHTSAKTGAGVDEAYRALVGQVLAQPPRLPPNPLVFRDHLGRTNQGGCCS
jgi:small GTP-binding protein